MVSDHGLGRGKNDIRLTGFIMTGCVCPGKKRAQDFREHFGACFVKKDRTQKHAKDSCQFVLRKCGS